jgi:hypothetical protein
MKQLPDDLERACAWLTERSYATGGGDTIEEVLAELEWQAIERGKRQALGDLKSLHGADLTYGKATDIKSARLEESHDGE